MKKLILISFVFISILFLFFYIKNELSEFDKIGEPIIKVKSIYFPEIKDSIFVKSKVWGITGNHKTAIITKSSNPEFKSDSLNDYVFKGFGEIILLKNIDELKVYSFQKPNIPKNFNSKVSIKLFPIKNNHELLELKKKNGLIIIE